MIVSELTRWALHRPARPYILVWFNFSVLLTFLKLGIVLITSTVVLENFARCLVLLLLLVGKRAQN